MTTRNGPAGRGAASPGSGAGCERAGTASGASSSIGSNRPLRLLHTPAVVRTQRFGVMAGSRRPSRRSRGGSRQSTIM